MNFLHWVGSIFAGIIFGIASLMGAATQPPSDVVPVQIADAAGDVSPAPSHMATKSASTSTSAVPPTQHISVLNVHALPLGDGKISSVPRVGYVYSCQQNFSGGGAEHAGDWIQGSAWDLTKKISVQGTVNWPEATFSAYLEGIQRILKGNGLPVGSITGTFPIERTDPAFQYDRNPNSVTAYTVSVALPAHPALAAQSSCVPMGAVGYALNGVAIYNALDDAGRDAVAHEVQDSCDGHPQGAGQYHYHGPSDCMPHANENNAVVGFALDGFPITSMYDAAGREYTNDDLDACHGITSPIVLDGKAVTTYHYVLTQEYPYTVGCFRGTPVRTTQQTTPQSRGNTPPQAAIDACTGKSAGASCTVQGGPTGTCENLGGTFACKPH